MAPPPATTAEFFIARRTIMMASCRLRSASSMNWSLPPRSTIVAVRARGHPLNRLKRSAPTCHGKSKKGSIPILGRTQACCGHALA